MEKWLVELDGQNWRVDADTAADAAKLAAKSLLFHVANVAIFPLKLYVRNSKNSMILEFKVKLGSDCQPQIDIT